MGMMKDKMLECAALKSFHSCQLSRSSWSSQQSAYRNTCSLAAKVGLKYFTKSHPKFSVYLLMKRSFFSLQSLNSSLEPASLQSSSRECSESRSCTSWAKVSLRRVIRSSKEKISPCTLYFLRSKILSSILPYVWAGLARHSVQMEAKARSELSLWLASSWKVGMSQMVICGSLGSGLSNILSHSSSKACLIYLLRSSVSLSCFLKWVYQAGTDEYFLPHKHLNILLRRLFLRFGRLLARGWAYSSSCCCTWEDQLSDYTPDIISNYNLEILGPIYIVILLSHKMKQTLRSSKPCQRKTGILTTSLALKYS